METENCIDVVIVGGGIAGLTSGAYLAKAGLRILLCEKNSQVGGLVSAFARDGFHFDAGARALENSGVIFPMLKQLGIEMEFVKNEISISLGNERIWLKDRMNIEDYQKLLVRHFPDNTKDIALIVREIKKVIRYMDVIYGIDNPLFSDQLDNPGYLLKTIMPWLVKYNYNMKKIKRLNQPINEYLSKFTENKVLIDFITQHFFTATPAFFALSYFGLYLDYFYPLHGTQELAVKLEKHIKDHGGFIVRNTKVEKVDHDDKIVTTASGEKFKYKRLIWAADNRTLYNILESKNDKTNMAIEARKIKVHQAKGGNSVFSVFLAVDRKPAYFQEKCGPHCFHTPAIKGISALEPPEQFTREKVKNYLQEYFNTTTYEISIPCLRNEHLAPANQSGIIISTLLDYGLVAKIQDELWYAEFKEFAMAAIIDVFDRSLFSGFKGDVLDSSSTTPLSIAKYNGSWQGAITGWSFENSKMPCESNLAKIAKAVETEFDDIFQCGQWSFSPSGVPVSIITGKMASDRIISSLKPDKGNHHG